jgi:NADPH:quinone reductase-like Zn-dependent oxidoreductase
VDNVGNHSLAAYGHLLQPRGRVVSLGAPPGNWIGPLVPMLETLMVSPFVKDRYFIFFAQLNGKDLDAMADLMQSGRVKAVIDRHYPLAQVPQAIAYLEAGHARGKVVIDVDSD